MLKCSPFTQTFDAITQLLRIIHLRTVLSFYPEFSVGHQTLSSTIVIRTIQENSANRVSARLTYHEGHCFSKRRSRSQSI